MSDEKTIDIRITREVRFKDGGRWPQGQELRTTRAELKDRGVPNEAFEVIDRAGGLPAAGNPEKAPPAEPENPEPAKVEAVAEPADPDARRQEEVDARLTFEPPRPKLIRMAHKLAKLADLKTAVNANTPGIDAELTGLLEQASAMAERAAGVGAGGLRRGPAVRFAYPYSANSPVRTFCLPVRPIEEVLGVVQLSRPGAPADFDAAVSAKMSLIPDYDYAIESTDKGRLVRLDGFWHIGEPNKVRVVYQAGLADPDDAVGGSAIEPPEDLQRAVVAQAVLLFNTRQTAGLKSVKAGDASHGLAEAGLHPLIEAAVSRYRRPL